MQDPEQFRRNYVSERRPRTFNELALLKKRVIQEVRCLLLQEDCQRDYKDHFVDLATLALFAYFQETQMKDEVGVRPSRRMEVLEGLYEQVALTKPVPLEKLNRREIASFLNKGQLYQVFLRLRVIRTLQDKDPTPEELMEIKMILSRLNLDNIEEVERALQKFKKHEGQGGWPGISFAWTKEWYDQLNVAQFSRQTAVTTAGLMLFAGGAWAVAPAAAGVGLGTTLGVTAGTNVVRTALSNFGGFHLKKAFDHLEKKGWLTSKYGVRDVLETAASQGLMVGSSAAAQKTVDYPMSYFRGPTMEEMREEAIRKDEPLDAPGGMTPEEAREALKDEFNVRTIQEYRKAARFLHPDKDSTTEDLARSQRLSQLRDIADLPRSHPGYDESPPESSSWVPWLFGR